MALHDEQREVMDSGNIDKSFDEGAHNMIVDLVQKYQYQYPEKSAVRELVSNALDAITERNNAISILRGNSKPEDYYVERDGSLYKDSKWTPDYYDLKWLSDDNTVKITYQERQDQRDLLTIKDYGVGLMGKRLAGYFKLGFSTKRNNINTLGKYGIGAKSALSTGISSYTVENRYNGMKMLFQVFDHTYQSIIPWVDMETGEPNPFIEIVVNGMTHKFYYLPTEEKNGLTIQIECKKHKKDYFIDAVKNQMMYFPNIELKDIQNNGKAEVLKHQADILYEDDYIILSNNVIFTKPHMLINRINYGYIDFKELELEEKYGNIGIKVAADQVTINPSRESLIWDDKTRDLVLQRYKEVSDIATNLINQSIHTENFVDWLFMMGDMSDDTLEARYGKNATIISRLKQIANLKEVSLYYTTPNGEQLSYKDVKNGFAVRSVQVKNEEKAGALVIRVVRSKVGQSAFKSGNKIFIKTEPGSNNNKRDKYLYDKYGTFYVLEHVDHAYNYSWYYNPESEDRRYVSKEMMVQFFSMMQYSLTDSKYESAFEVYENVVVEGDYTDTEEDVLEEAVEDFEEEKVVGPKEKKTTLTFSTFIPDDWQQIKVLRDTAMAGSWGFYEIDKADITKIVSPEVYYCNYGEDEDILYAKVMHLTKGKVPYEARHRKEYLENIGLDTNRGSKPDQQLYGQCPIRYKAINSNNFEQNYSFLKQPNGKIFYRQGATLLDQRDISVLRVAQSNVKHFKRFKHLSLFFAELRNNTIKMSTALVKWNTARIIEKNLYKCRFLSGFSHISPEHWQEYNRLKAYVDAYFVPLTGIDKNGFKAWKEGEVDDLIDHCERIYQFQSLVSSGAAPEVIADTAKEMFGNNQVKNAHGADLEIIKAMDTLLEFCEPLQLLNCVPQFTGDTVTVHYQYSVKDVDDIESLAVQYVNSKMPKT